MPQQNSYSTAQIASQFGLHPNTIRQYEEKGWLTPVPRQPNGYRVFLATHIEQIKLIQIALYQSQRNHGLNNSALMIVQSVAQNDMDEALSLAEKHLENVRMFRFMAEQATRQLQQWAFQYDATSKPQDCWLTIAEAASLLGVSTDVLRSWDRDRLFDAPRNVDNGYRIYSSQEIRHLQRIKELRDAGFSMMAILRMNCYLQLGEVEYIAEALNTPCTGEQALSANDHWLTSLAEMEHRGQQMISMVQQMVEEQTQHNSEAITN